MQTFSSFHFTPVPVIQNFTTVNGIQFTIRLSAVVAISASGDFTCALQASGQPQCWGHNAEGEVGNGGFSADIARPFPVNSFTANVAPDAFGFSNQRLVVVTALINCEAGAQAVIILTLEQDSITGGTAIVSACTGGLEQVPMVVPTQPAPFHSGLAVAHVEAIVIEQDAITQDQHWDRDVTISAFPYFLR